jgi:ribosome assembly protein RRB1
MSLDWFRKNFVLIFEIDIICSICLFQTSGTLPAPVVAFRYHRAPVTSLEWNPNDSSVLAVAAADDRLTIWDFAVESEDASVSASSSAMSNDVEESVPAQLLFVHQGQKEIKELHWHRQLPGVIISTAGDGFNIFRTISA